MRAWFHCTGAALLAADPADIAGRLAAAQARRHRGTEPEQLLAWERQIALLRTALAAVPGAAGWTVALEFDLLRLEKRVDAVLLTDRAILSLEFKTGARTFAAADLVQAEDYALDLHDFHAGSRRHPVVPVLVATEAPAPVFAPPLIWHGVAEPVLRANAATLPALLRDIQAAIPPPHQPLDHGTWLAAPYRPVPTIVEAATMLFARHGVAEIAAARADAANLRQTTEAVRRAAATARAEDERVVVFVTGIPGAGKTLCGLNVVFGAERDGGSAFLTGNAPLVTVLREALARDAAGADRGRALAPARRRTAAALQNVHRFLEHHVTRPHEIPAERLVVFDEAQRAWDAAQATRDTQRRVSRLTASEPAHMLEIMARHPGWSVVVALIGNGQEINTGEAGLAEWGRAIGASWDDAGARGWRAVAAPRVLDATAAAAQRLADGPRPWLTLDPDLDLTVPMRAVRDAGGAAWVDAVLAGDTAAARRIAREAAGGVPFLLTRDLAALRAELRRLARGLRRAGLVCSAGGAKRLRAEGLGVQLAGADMATADWFLRRWPDVRASDALEVCATEYACQGLELDVVGLAWGGDLVRGPAAGGWQPREFRGDAWTRVARPENRDFVLNTYRVLLTRARYETVVWVPRGDPADRTRPPGEFDAVADHLLACGAELIHPHATPAATPEPALL